MIAHAKEKVPDTFWLVTNGFCERPISLLGRYATTRTTCIGARNTGHTGCRGGAGGFRSRTLTQASGDVAEQLSGRMEQWPEEEEGGVL